MTLATALGTLTLDYDPTVGVSASINAVPEPTALVMAGTAVVAGPDYGRAVAIFVDQARTKNRHGEALPPLVRR